MWIRGKKFYDRAVEVMEEKGAELVKVSTKKFNRYKIKNAEVTVPYHHMYTFSIFIVLENGEEHNYHQNLSCSLDSAIEQFKQHLELITK